MKNHIRILVLLIAGASLLPVAGLEAAKSHNWGKDIPAYDEGRLVIRQDGPTLVFSDSPEMVRENGIMYQDIVIGEARLFFHHVNDTAAPKKIAVMLRNTENVPAKIIFRNKGIAEPDYDYLRAGKEVQRQFFGYYPNQVFYVPVGGSMEILTGVGQITLKDQLVTGMLDFSTDRRLEVSVLMTWPEKDVKEALTEERILPPDDGNVLRGTFPLADRIVDLKKSYKPDEGKIVGVLIADNVYDVYAAGIDATTGKRVVNYGNYGIVYDIRYKIKGEQRIRIRLNPWGGWFAGAGRVSSNGEERFVLFPQKETAFGKTGSETIVIAEEDGFTEGRILFSPPGASNLPIRLFFETVEE